METTLPRINRVITTHDQNGKGVFTTGNLDSEEIPWQPIGPMKRYGLAYTTSSTPANLQDDQDVRQYEQHLQQKPGMVVPHGSALRCADFGPGTFSPHHRTISIDYGVVIEGSIELELESGERRKMHRGDISIMRAVIHGWRNVSKDEWCRMLFVLIDAEAPVINGVKLTEDYGKAIVGVPSSGPSQAVTETSTATACSKTLKLVSVNNAPERARRLIGRVIDRFEGRYDIVHAANVEDPDMAKTIFTAVQPDVVFTASMWAPELSSQLLALAREVNPDCKTLAIPQGLQVERGPDAVVDWLVERVPGLIES